MTVTIKDVLVQGRALLLDPNVGPVVTAPSLDPGANRLRDVRVPGAPSDAGGTQGWMAGETGFPFALLTASDSGKSYKESGRVTKDYLGWLHIGLAAEVDGFTDLRGWAYDWDTALEQWFPTTYRLGPLGQTENLGDLYWLYERGTIGMWQASGRTFFGLVCRLKLHLTATITWNVGLPSVP